MPCRSGSIRPHKPSLCDTIRGVLAGTGQKDSNKRRKEINLDEECAWNLGVEQLEDKEHIDMEEDLITSAPIVAVKDPGGPTAEELALHELTHLPHRSWCPICVKARGKEDPHYRAAKNKVPWY